MNTAPENDGLEPAERCRASAGYRCPETVGVILAGGAARRMGGGDKTLCNVGGMPILARIISAIGRGCAALVLNANDDASRFAAFGLPVIADDLPGRPGPLAGILAGLEWAAIHHPSAPWLLSVPGDTPFLPPDLLIRLHTRRDAEDAELALAVSGMHAHPIVAVWPVSIAAHLRRVLEEGGTRRVSDFARSLRAVSVAWAVEPIDPFANINHPAQLDAARAIVKRDGFIPQHLRT